METLQVISRFHQQTLVFMRWFMVFQKQCAAVATGNATNLTVSRGQSLTNNGAVLQKTYNFVVRLNFDPAIYDDLNVLAEPAV